MSSCKRYLFSMPTKPQLNPAQQEVLDMLGATMEERPKFDNELRVELKAALEIAIDPLAKSIPDNDILFVGKRQLAQVMGCETRYLAELEDNFTWSIPTARGTIAHKAIELSVHWRGTTEPVTLVDETLAKLEFDEASLGKWLQGISEADRAELRAEASTRVTAFFECWPALKPEWRPSLEMPVRVELAQGKIILAGKVDLALGRAAGNIAGKVLVDLKTGRFSPIHRDDLRYYALLDAIRVGTPPRLLATYYLDQGRFTPEAVTIPLLEAANARVVESIHRMVELHYREALPGTQAGPTCHWCPVLSRCDVGDKFVNSEVEELTDIDI